MIILKKPILKKEQAFLGKTLPKKAMEINITELIYTVIFLYFWASY